LTILTLRSTFTIFPDGLPGLGLLLLRAIAGVALASCGVIHLIAWQEARLLPLIVATLSSICGLLLLFGLFNWLACSLGALISLVTALTLIQVPVSDVLSAKVSGMFTAVITVALLCLGPGAYSLDARRHGRREIIIPTRPRSSDDSSP
jgi:putative oxidoreductase